MAAMARAPIAWMAVLAVAVSCLPPSEADGPYALVPTPGVEEEAPAPISTSQENDDEAVVLIALDGVRWQEVFVGSDPSLSRASVVPAEALMHHLHRLVAEQGAALGAPGHGPPIAASGPNFVSLPGYSEIFSGRRISGCKDNDCAPTTGRTVFDELASRAAAITDVAVFASWERIDRAASVRPSSLVLSVGRTREEHPDAMRDDPVAADWLDRGKRADPSPGWGDFRPDRLTASVALRYLETKRPRLLFVGLGEPDEYGHRGDYPGYLGSLRACDEAIGDLLATLGRMGARGAHTTVLVTTDHGRGVDWRHHGRQFPESARTWLVAGGGRVQARGYVRARYAHRLSDIAPTIRDILDLPADVSPSAGAALGELLAPPAIEAAVLP
jgi:hypothetical protein